MHGNPTLFYQSIAGFLGCYYVALSLMNGLAAMYLWLRKDKAGQAFIWTVVALINLILAAFALNGDPAWAPSLPQVVRDTIDKFSGPVTYTLGTTGFLLVMFLGRKFFVKGPVAWAGLNLALLLLGLSMTDPDFASIVTKPDNVPIVGLVFLLGFFTWVATSKAVENDDRISRGLPPKEAEDSEKVLVWPDLVYTELICMVALTAFLIVWAILLKAPLEEPATSVKTPNPSKAPWYFLGLQEMLVYYDPWMAGVVLPTTVIFGLAAIPYMDFNKKGSGYYTINQRKFSYLVFQTGFLVLWITLIILGTFLRGPNWNFFGPFEYWDSHKVLALDNIDLSEYFWIKLMDQTLPRAPLGTGQLAQIPYILLREAPGILLLGAYFALLPPLMATTVFRTFFMKMGFIRFLLMSNLFLLMILLPIKMVLRWTLNLKYFIHIDEWFLNF